MRLLKAKFHNWCQHKDLTVDFVDGLNAIRGPNGSGKSNILTGVVFGLTGDFSRNPGVKVDNIYQLAGEKERAGVTLDLLHGATKLTLERNLRPNSQKLTIAGAEHPITKADEINAKVQELLGVNECLLLDYVFVDQWKIFAFVDQSPGVRAKAFGELFNATKAETIWKVLGEFKIDVPVPSIDGDRVRVRIAETENEVKQLQEELARYNHLPEMWKYEDDPLRLIVFQFNHKETMLGRVDQLNEVMASNCKAIEATKATVEPVETELHGFKQTLAGLSGTVEQAKIDLASWAAYETVGKARAMLENEVYQLRKERDSKQSPVKPDDYNGPIYKQHEAQIAAWQAEVTAAQKLLNTFDPKLGIAACPTCGTDAAVLQEKLHQAYTDIDAYRKQIIVLSDKMTRSKTFDTATTYHLDWAKRNADSLHTAEVRLLNLGAAKEPTKEREQLQELVADYQEIQEQVQTREREVRRHHDELHKLQGKLSLLEGQRLDLTVAINNVTVSAEQAAAAKVQLDQKQEQFNLRNNLRYKLDMRLKLLKDDEAALQKFQLDERKAGKLRRLVTHLEDVRGIFKELPQVAAQACLDSMIEEINDVLEKFDAPFRVLNVDNLKFTLRKHSGVTVPAERLSGGEKAVFALAFRIVVNSRFAGSLGLLCLDEPTAGLDEDNVACLEVALGRLRELSTSRGLQVVLITHETGLDGLFDRVIKLSPVH